MGEKCLFWEIILGGNDKEEIVTLELINEVEVTENEDHKPPKKPQIQSCITQFFKINKKMSLKRLNVEKIQAIYFSEILFFPK